MLGYGLSYLGYFLRPRYFDWVVSLGLDENFGIEGSIMAIIVNLVVCILAIVIGTLIRKKKENG